MIYFFYRSIIFLIHLSPLFLRLLLPLQGLSQVTCCGSSSLLFRGLLSGLLHLGHMPVSESDTCQFCPRVFTCVLYSSITASMGHTFRLPLVTKFVILSNSHVLEDFGRLALGYWCTVGMRYVADKRQWRASFDRLKITRTDQLRYGKLRQKSFFKIDETF